MGSIISTQETKKQSFRLRLRTVLIIGAIIAIASGAYLLFAWRQAVKENTSTDETVRGATDLADRTAAGGKYDQAQAIIDAEIRKDGDVKLDVDLYIQKAVIALNAKKYDDALAAALKAEGLAASYQTASLVAQIAEQKGDKAQAITYYQYLLDRMTDQQKELAPYEVEDIQSKIKALKQ